MAQILAVPPTTTTKDAVEYATASPLPASVYSNGSGGISATLQASAPGALTVDGVAVVAGQRILVKNEASTFRNGLYLVTQAGTSGSVWLLTRSEDADTADTLVSGVCVAAAGPSGAPGATNDGTLWVASVPAGAVIGTSAVAWIQIAGGGGTVASVTGSTVDNTDPANPVVNADAAGAAASAQSAAISAAASDATSKANAAQSAAQASSAQRASNLSDLASATTARGNLGLGTAATHGAAELLPPGGKALTLLNKDSDADFVAGWVDPFGFLLSNTLQPTANGQILEAVGGGAAHSMRPAAGAPATAPLTASDTGMPTSKTAPWSAWGSFRANAEDVTLLQWGTVVGPASRSIFLHHGAGKGGATLVALVVQGNGSPDFFPRAHWDTDAAQTFNDDAVHTIGMVWEGTGNDLHLYLDGVDQGAPTVVGAASVAAFADVVLGGGLLVGWNGITASGTPYLDEVAFFNGIVLSQTDIDNLEAARGNDGLRPRLIALGATRYYGLDELGTVAIDLGTDAIDGSYGLSQTQGAAPLVGGNTTAPRWQRRLGPTGVWIVVGTTGAVWSSGTTYSAGDVVQGSDTNYYTSTLSGNVGNDPVSDGGLHWVFTPPFENSRSNQGSPYFPVQFRLENSGSIVRLAGIVGGANTTATAFTLPIGYRPPHKFTTIVDTGNVPPVLEPLVILVSGEVQMDNSGVGQILLDNITFPVT